MAILYCVSRSLRSHRPTATDQMVQAARSGKQNIAEGSQASGTSRKTELKLINVARASLEELLQDYLDFLRQRSLILWPKTHPTANHIRKLAYAPIDRTPLTLHTSNSPIPKWPPTPSSA